jgi:predicted transposase YdaD
VKPGSKAKGLSLVQAKLEFEELGKQDRIDYLKAIENRVIERDVWQTNLEEAEDKGMARGMAQQKREGIVRALKRGKLTIDEIAEDFDVPVEEVKLIQQQEGL